MADEHERHRQDIQSYVDAQARARPAPHAGTAAMADADIERLLAQAEGALSSVDPMAPRGQPPPVTQFQWRDFGGSPEAAEATTLEGLRDVQLEMKIELGRTQMVLEDVLKLRRGTVVPLDRLVGEPVDVIVNGRLIARGEVLVLNDNFCVRVAELVTGDPDASSAVD